MFSVNSQCQRIHVSCILHLFDYRATQYVDIDSYNSWPSNTLTQTNAPEADTFNQFFIYKYCRYMFASWWLDNCNSLNRPYSRNRPDSKNLSFLRLICRLVIKQIIHVNYRNNPLLAAPDTYRPTSGIEKHHITWSPDIEELRSHLSKRQTYHHSSTLAKFHNKLTNIYRLFCLKNLLKFTHHYTSRNIHLQKLPYLGTLVKNQDHFIY